MGNELFSGNTFEKQYRYYCYWVKPMQWLLTNVFHHPIL